MTTTYVGRSRKMSLVNMGLDTIEPNDEIRHCTGACYIVDSAERSKRIRGRWNLRVTRVENDAFSVDDPQVIHTVPTKP